MLAFNFINSCWEVDIEIEKLLGGDPSSWWFLLYARCDPKRIDYSFVLIMNLIFGRNIFRLFHSHLCVFLGDMIEWWCIIEWDVNKQKFNTSNPSTRIQKYNSCQMKITVGSKAKTFLLDAERVQYVIQVWSQHVINLVRRHHR